MASRERDDAMAGLLKRNLAGDAGAGNDCPGPDILAAYFERSLDAGETAHVELHLSECARCREQLAALGRAEEAAATPAVQAPRHQPRASWIWDWRWLAPAAAVLVIAAVWATRRPTLTQIANHVAQPAQEPAAVPAPASAPEQQPIEPAARQAAPEARGRVAPLEAAAPRNDATRILEPAPASRSSAMDSTAGTAVANVEKSKRQDLVTPKSIENRPLNGRSYTELKKVPEPAPGAKSGATDQAPNAPAVTSESLIVQPESSTIGTIAPAPSKAKNEAQAGVVGGAIATETTNAKQERAAVNGLQMAQVVATTQEQLAASFIVQTPDKKILWRIGSAGFVERSEDGGLTWNGTLPKQNAHYVAGSAPSANVCWLVGNEGVILLTQDGSPWQLIPPPVRANFVAVAARDAWSATVTTADGHKFTTTNQGESWTPAK